MADPAAPPYNGFGAEARAYEPTLRDKLARLIAGDKRLSPEWERLLRGLVGSTGLGNTSVSALDFTPIGPVFGAQEAVRNDEPTSGVAMSFMPAPGRVVRGFHGSPSGKFRALSAAAPETPSPAPSPASGGDMFSVLSRARKGNDRGRPDEAWFSDRPDVADGYAMPNNAADRTGAPAVMPGDIDTTNFGVFDGGGRHRNDVDEALERAIGKARERGKSGLIIQNMMDDPGGMQNQYVVFDRGRVTSPYTGNLLYGTAGLMGISQALPEGGE